jgi:hypothetical protein
MSSFVVLRTFSSRGEAQSVQAVLSGSGIETFIESDDCGALDPALSFGRGVQLLVAEEDVDRAADVMSQVVPPESTLE